MSLLSSAVTEGSNGEGFRIGNLGRDLAPKKSRILEHRVLATSRRANLLFGLSFGAISVRRDGNLYRNLGGVLVFANWIWAGVTVMRHVGFVCTEGGDEQGPVHGALGFLRLDRRGTFLSILHLLLVRCEFDVDLVACFLLLTGFSWSGWLVHYDVIPNLQIDCTMPCNSMGVEWFCLLLCQLKFQGQSITDADYQ